MLCFSFAFRYCHCSDQSWNGYIFSTRPSLHLPPPIHTPTYSSIKTASRNHYDTIWDSLHIHAKQNIRVLLLLHKQWVDMIPQIPPGTILRIYRNLAIIEKKLFLFLLILFLLIFLFTTNLTTIIWTFIWFQCIHLFVRINIKIYKNSSRSSSQSCIWWYEER